MFSDQITVNEYFDNVYLLNLDKRPDRLKRTSKKLEKFNIKFERFSAVDGLNLKKSYKIDIKILGYPECIMGCCLSNINIIKDAIKKQYKRILIFEDDIMISEKFNEYFQNVKKLDDWKLLYLGASQGLWHTLKYKDNFFLCKETFGGFAYAIDNSIFNEILEFSNYFINNDILMPIDQLLIDTIQKKYYGKCFGFFPNIVISDISDSNIRINSWNNAHIKRAKWDILDDYV